MRENDTEPTRADTRTDPDGSGDVVHDTIEEPLPVNSGESNDLLGGLRRDRPPPKLAPRAAAASEGGEAVAYYGGPKSLPARFDTPSPEPAVEIAITPPMVTQPSALRLAQEAARKAAIVAPAQPASPSPSPSPSSSETASSVRRFVWGGAIGVLALGFVAAIAIVRLGASENAAEAMTSASASASATTPTTVDSAPAPAVPVSPASSASTAPQPSTSSTPAAAPMASVRPHQRAGHPASSSPTTITTSVPSPSPSPSPSPRSSYAQPDRTL